MTGGLEYSGLSAFTAINTAFTALTSSGGKVFLREGTFPIGTNILQIPGNVHLVGSGIDQSIITGTGYTTGSATDIIQNLHWASGADSNIRIADLTVQGDNTGAGAAATGNHGNAIWLAGVTDYVIERVKCKYYLSFGINIAGANAGVLPTPGTCYNGWIERNTVLSQKSGCVRAGNVVGLHIEENYISGGDTPLQTVGATQNTGICNGVWVERNRVDMAGNNGCLLYTSPSPRDLSTSRMPSSA